MKCERGLLEDDDNDDILMLAIKIFNTEIEN